VTSRAGVSAQTENNQSHRVRIICRAHHRGEQNVRVTARPAFYGGIILKSTFVYSRVLSDGRVVICIGEGRTPEGTRTLGTFRSLEEAIRFRDRKRLEAAFGLADGPLRLTARPTMRQRGANALEMASYADAHTICCQFCQRGRPPACAGGAPVHGRNY
jgi:hypothetical protein